MKRFLAIVAALAALSGCATFQHAKQSANLYQAAQEITSSTGVAVLRAAPKSLRYGASFGASGGSEVGSFPNAAPLNGSERILADQNATTVNLTPAQIGQYLGIPNGLVFPLSVANGGNGTATPALTAGTNVTLSGTWPDYTINATGGASFPSCTADQLYYAATTGTTASCLTLGTNLSITSGTLNATGGGSMTWPAAAGIPCYSGSSTWCTSYSASNLIPYTYLPATMPQLTSANGSAVPASAGTLLGTGSSAASFPTLNQSTTGNAATATDLSTTGANGTFWGVSGGVQGYYTPTAAASSITPGTTTVSGATAPCLIDNSTGTTMGCLPSPTSGAGYYSLRSDPTSATAVAPTYDQVGASTVSISGATSTYTVPYSVVNGMIVHDKAGSAAVTVTLPTPTTLNNAHFSTNYCNNSAQTDTITPTTWTIALNNGTAGASISVASGECVSIVTDPFNSTQWDAFTYGAGSSGMVYPGAGIPQSTGTAWGTSITPGTGVVTALGNNVSSAGGLTETIASGTATLGTTAIASGACATVVTVAATGVATTDVVKAGFNSDPTGVTGYGVSATGAVLTIYPYPTAGNVNFKVCNSYSASITPGAMTLNWSVTR